MFSSHRKARRKNMFMSLFSSNETGAAFAVALKMRYQTTFFYLLSSILMFVCLGLIYNLDKKTLAKIQSDLAERHAGKKNPE